MSLTIIDLKEKRLPKIKVMICQITWDCLTTTNIDDLYFVQDDSKIEDCVNRYINVAANEDVDLIVFPELCIPDTLQNLLFNFSKNHNVFIIAGTHYKKIDNKYFSICPLITPKKIYDIKKINPSPYEKSSFPNCGLTGSDELFIFKNTRIGNFAVTICADYLDSNLKSQLSIENLDLLIIPAFQRDSKTYFDRMQIDIQNSIEGMYILYCNTFSKDSADGNSSLFGLMYEHFKEQFKNHNCTDLNPNNKIYCFPNDVDYAILELDLDHRRPFQNKTIYSGNNVTFITDNRSEVTGMYDFLSSLGVSDDKYKYIKDLYVAPNEYQDIKNSLEKNNVVLLVGDPGIGKTYTAIRLMYEYYCNKYKPTWFYGLTKEDREELKDSLINYEPKPNEIAYLEDPFGHSHFEYREELNQIFLPLIQKFKEKKSKLIITSRNEVFLDYSKESLNSHLLEPYKKDLNIRKPSYSKQSLKLLAEKQLDYYSNWANNSALVNILFNAIDNGNLETPLLIHNTIKAFRNSPNEKDLESYIKKEKTNDLVTPLAQELKNLPINNLLFLYIVFLYGKLPYNEYLDAFDRVQINLSNKGMKFESSSFLVELQIQLNYRIQKIGMKAPVFRFSHPLYEEALTQLLKNNTCSKTIINEIFFDSLKQEHNYAYHILIRQISRHPEIAYDLLLILERFQTTIQDDFRLVLSNKLYSCEDERLKKKAISILPINDLLELLYNSQDTNNVFVTKLRLLRKRKDEIKNLSHQIEWKRIFTQKRINSFEPQKFLRCLEIALSLEENVISVIELVSDKFTIQKKYILLDKSSRESFRSIFENSKFNNIITETERVLFSIDTSGKRGERVNAKTLVKLILKKQDKKGIIYIDDGAYDAMLRYAILYPIGIKKIQGVFDSGDKVIITTGKSDCLPFISIVEQSSAFIEKYKGQNSQTIIEDNDGVIVNTGVSRANYRIKACH